MSRPIHVRLFSLALFAPLVLAAVEPARAATLIWPVVIGPGCNGSLQECINGATAGDTVRIVNDDLLTPDGYTAIDEEIEIFKSLTLEAAPGVDAVFAPGRMLLVESPNTGAMVVTLRRLTLQGDLVRVNHFSSAPGTYTLDRIRVDELPITNCAIDLNDRGTGSASFVVGDSTLRFTQPLLDPPSAICARGDRDAWQLSLFRNYIESRVGALEAGILVDSGNSGNITISGNQLIVHGAAHGIELRQRDGAPASLVSIHDNLVTGQSSRGSRHAIGVRPVNTDLRVVNNTLARNGDGLRVFYRDGDTSIGRIANNVFAFNGVALEIDAGYTTFTRDQNLGFGNGVDGIAVGEGTVGVDPQFVGMHDFRLRATSPARDNGNNADVPTVLGVAFDADGERRIANGIVDIGAFEWIGDQSVRHVATATNISGNNTLLQGLDSLGSFENVILTPLRGPVTGAELAQTLGAFQSLGGAGTYYAFHEDIDASLTPGRRIHAFVPLIGATGFLHTTTLGSVVDAYSRISHPELDSRPGAIAIVTHNWNPGGGAGVYHDHRLGLDYAAPNWFVGNQDGAAMPSGRAFNIAVAPVGSPNAFVREVGGTARAELRLEHALLDDNGCATLQVGRTGSAFNNTAFSVEYREGGPGAPGHWFIVAEGAGSPTFPANTAFNVMVSGAQANACRTTLLFSDGFE